LPTATRLGVGALTTVGRKEQPMTSQHHESMKTLISDLNIMRYQGLLKTRLDETERQSIQTLLADEQVWLKQNMPKADQRSGPRRGK
jgi:hypothetical protein